MELASGNIKLIITDDHKLIRVSLRDHLGKRDRIEIIGESTNGKELLDQLEHLQPDVIIMGFQMPVMSGLDTLPVIKKRYPGIRVIIYSMHEDKSIVRRFLEEGANSYLSKNCGIDEIYEAVIGCYEKWFFLSKNIRIAIAQIQEASPNAEVLNFTEKDIRLFKMMEKQELPDKMAAQLDLSVQTIYAMIDRLRNKTGLKGFTEMVIYAKKNKLIN